MVSLQPALWLIWAAAGKPAFIEEDVEVVFPESLAVLNAKVLLDFAGLAGLFAELEASDRDLAGRRLTFSLLGLFDELGMNGLAHQEEGSVFVGFKGRRRGAVWLYVLSIFSTPVPRPPARD